MGMSVTPMVPVVLTFVSLSSDFEGESVLITEDAVLEATGEVRI